MRLRRREIQEIRHGRRPRSGRCATLGIERPPLTLFRNAVAELVDGHRLNLTDFRPCVKPPNYQSTFAVRRLMASPWYLPYPRRLLRAPRIVVLLSREGRISPVPSLNARVCAAESRAPTARAD